MEQTAGNPSVTLEEFTRVWLESILEDGPSPVEKGHRRPSAVGVQRLSVIGRRSSKTWLNT